jgi:hypothetical protein
MNSINPELEFRYYNLKKNNLNVEKIRLITIIS